MNLPPECAAFIYIPDRICCYIKLFLARPVDANTLQNLEKLSSYLEKLSFSEGISISYDYEEPGEPWTICTSPVYNPKTIGLELEKVLRKHKINNILIRLDNANGFEEVETLIS